MVVHLQNHKMDYMKVAAKNKFILLLLTFFLFFISCKKSNPATDGGGTGTLIERLFETNVLNQNFIVSLATADGTDITAQYSGFTFKMLKTDYYKGPMEASKDGNTYTGTWSSNSDYSKLVITLPNSPAPFIFLTRSWKFTKKDFDQMELAPWVSSEGALVLHMRKA
jgi:hypothetical protein